MSESHHMSRLYFVQTYILHGETKVLSLCRVSLPDWLGDWNRWRDFLHLDINAKKPFWIRHCVLTEEVQTEWPC